MRRLPLILLFAMASSACDSVVPPNPKFASETNPGQFTCTTALQPPGQGDPITLGAVLPMTGPDGKPDDRALHRSRAMVLGMEEANQRGGVADRLFRLRVCDTGGGWVTSGEDEARGLATWLVDHEGVQALLAGGSGDTLAIQSVTRQRGALLMSVSATAMEITDLMDDGLVWRVAPSDLHQGLVLAWLAEAALAKTSNKTVAVMAISNPYGDGLNKVISDHLPADSHVAYILEADGSNLASELKRANGDKPGALIVVASALMSAQVVNALAQHKNLAAAQVLLSDSAHNPDMLAAVKDSKLLAGVRGTLPGGPAGPAYKTFASRYMSKFGADPAQQSYTAHSYDAAYCLALAHAWALGAGGSAKVDGKSLSEGLQQLASAATPTTLEPTGFSTLRKSLMSGNAVNIAGASGPLDFDPESGEASSPVQIWSVSSAGAFASEKWVHVVNDGGVDAVQELP